MITGITTTFFWLLKRQIWQEYSCAGNRWSQPISDLWLYQAQPLVFTNIFRDQMWLLLWGDLHRPTDDSGMLQQKFPATVLMNGDSPLFNSVSLKNPVRYYGFDTEKARLSNYNTEGILCPASISSSTSPTPMPIWFICEDCGFKRSKLDYSLTSMLLHNCSCLLLLMDKTIRSISADSYNTHSVGCSVSGSILWSWSYNQVWLW